MFCQTTADGFSREDTRIQEEKSGMKKQGLKPRGAQRTSDASVEIKFRRLASAQQVRQ
jgi:hypothetical protein